MPLVKAAVCRAFNQPLVIEEIMLAPPRAGQVEVSLDAVAVCHSDISFAEGAWGGHLPAVFGHEGAGRITAVGPGTMGFDLDDPVVVTLIRPCGGCLNCITGHPTICTEPQNTLDHPLSTADGAPIFQAMDCAAFAEKVVVDASQIVKLPQDMPRDAACLLGCGVITGVGAVVNAAQLRPGQDAVVIGAGGIGLNAIQGARIAGARRIVAVDMTDDKLETARAFGATHGVLATGKAPWRDVQQALGRGADAVFVSVGSAAAYTVAPKYAGFGGKIVAIGMPHSGQTSEYEAVNLSFAGQKIIGSKMGDTVIQRDIPWMVDLYQQGRLKLEDLISGRWRLDQINDAMADTKAGGAKRNVILFD
ncbi:MAG: Zn-dependent alcohol dehydrogenase [Pseudomonadota bacterium]